MLRNRHTSLDDWSSLSCMAVTDAVAEADDTGNGMSCPPRRSRETLLGTDEQDLWRPLEDWRAD